MVNYYRWEEKLLIKYSDAYRDSVLYKQVI